MMSILPDSRKVFWEMSKQMSAKRQHDEAAKFSGSITNKNEIKGEKAKMKTIQPRMKNPAMLMLTSCSP